MRYIIGIDIGTTNTKAVAFTDEGIVLGSAGVSYSIVSEVPGQHELDPETLLAAVVSVLREVREKTSSFPEPAGVSFSCAMHSLIVVDAGGKPLTRAMTWADLRPAAYAETLKQSAAGRRIYRQTGTPIHAMSPLCKLLWLKAEQPDLFGKAAKFISIKEYIWWRLLGEYRLDHSVASATGLLDIRTFNWFDESLELAGIRAGQLSELVSSTYSVRKPLAQEFRGILGLTEGLPFIIGGSDGCLANLGSGAIRTGETALTIGTSGAIRMTAPAPEYDVRERIFSYILTDKHYVCGGATNNGGNVLQWYMDGVQGQRGEGLEHWMAAAEQAPPGCEGLVFLPYLRGERAPVWDANAKGVFFGVQSTHGQPHFMRSILEGISYSLCQVGASLEETLGSIQHIYASGGFTRSKGWLQMAADVFNKQVYVTGIADASAIGAAMMGFYSLGMVSELEDTGKLVKVLESYEPDAGRHAVYKRNYQVFIELYSRLKDLM
ncbi:MAG: gluconokinase [Bacteroidetes bacterium]|nr:gluconokinase [Bacteroidota bacterium]